MNDWISRPAFPGFCSISDMPLLQPSGRRGPAHTGTHPSQRGADRLPHSWADATPGSHTAVRSETGERPRPRPDTENHEDPSLRALPLHSWRRRTELEASCDISSPPQGPKPLVMPFELVPLAPWPFLPSAHLVVPWVVLAPLCARCGEACSFGSPKPSSAQAFPSHSLRPLGPSVPPVGLVRGQQGRGCAREWRVSWAGWDRAPPSAGICNHLELTPTSRQPSSLCWGHSASVTDGPVCQLPRDLTQDPNRSAFLEGRTVSPLLPFLKAGAADETISVQDAFIPVLHALYLPP